jgi:hypothetical protein
MICRAVASTAALAAAVCILLIVQTPAAGQAASPTTKTTDTGKVWTAPSTADGKPDLQGVWGNATLTPLERPKGLGAKEFYTEQEFAELAKRVRQGIVGNEADLGAAAEQTLRYDLSLYGFDLTKATFASNKRTSLIVGPEGVVPPMLPEARKRNAERAAKNKGHEFDSYENRPLQERCILMAQERVPMIPGANDNNLLQIVQGPGYVSLFHEIDHSTRVIPTDGRPHIPQNIRHWQGDSVGHWEGNTLVVDTTNFDERIIFNNNTCCRGSGANLHVVERFTRADAGTIDYRFTVDDPTTYTRPWTVAVPMTKVDIPIYEYACHEGNYGMKNLLSAARAKEKAAEEAAKKK